MKRALSSRQPLAGTALLLAALGAWPWVAPAGTAAAPVAAERAASPQPLPKLPPLASLSAIAERPLFSSTRRPNALVAGPAAAAAAGHYRLLGVIGIGNARRALIGDGPRRIEINEGVALDNWTVKRIETDQVLLVSPQGENVLRLQRSGPETAPAAPR